MSKKVDVVIIGAGPAGMFASEILAREGKSVALIDMGKPIHERRCPKVKECNCKICDILEGEGGAGGFSDGKKTYSLTRGTQMEELFSPEHAHWLKWMDNRIIAYGGEGFHTDGQKDGYPEMFSKSRINFETYELRHIGSDGVQKFVELYCGLLTSIGVEIITRTKVVDITVNPQGKADGVITLDRKTGASGSIEADEIIVASGLQGSPWFEEWAIRKGIVVGDGPAGIGMRVEAPYEVLKPLFDEFYDFKLTMKTGGITVRSFCCNQRGYIVNENHNLHRIINVNGHSYINESMKSMSSNFAMIAKVTRPFVVRAKGLQASTPQGFVRDVARKVNEVADGRTAMQGILSFMERSEYLIPPDAESTITNRQAKAVDIAGCLPAELRYVFQDFLYELGRSVEGLLSPKTVVYAPEMKYYGFKIPVDFSSWESRDIKGLYVVGNASGYLDSFISAGLSGILAARHIISKGGE